MDEELKKILDYRNKLEKYKKIVVEENPDRLNETEMDALQEKIKEQILHIDYVLGYPVNNIMLKYPTPLSEELFREFIDYYQIKQTSSGLIYDYVTSHFNPQRFKNILCVGDGENCHLGRKLAELGYNVICVDPVANGKYSNKNLQVINACFGEKTVTSYMVDWADLIIGSKVPMIAEYIISQYEKPGIINISTNAEIHNIVFDGERIHSSRQLAHLISQHSNVQVVKGNVPQFGVGNWIFVCNGDKIRQKVPEEK